MRTILRDNSLSLVMFGLFGLCLLGHSLAGYAAYRDDQQAHQQPPIRYTAYVTSSHFWASVFENWESEFLQMAAYVLATVFCFQRGSAESKDPDSREEVDEDPRQHQHEPQAPGPVRKGGLALTLYAHSLSTALRHTVRRVLPRPCGEWDPPVQRRAAPPRPGPRVHAPVPGHRALLV